MKKNKKQKFREKKYRYWVKHYPQHADDFKRFIYRDGKVKDNFNIMPEVRNSLEPLCKIVHESDCFIDEELKDIQRYFKKQLGRKKFKKLRKIFTL